jgi:hypothetical protein
LSSKVGSDAMYNSLIIISHHQGLAIHYNKKCRATLDGFAKRRDHRQLCEIGHDQFYGLGKRSIILFDQDKSVVKARGMGLGVTRLLI